MHGTRGHADGSATLPSLFAEFLELPTPPDEVDIVGPLGIRPATVVTEVAVLRRNGRLLCSMTLKNIFLSLPRLARVHLENWKVIHLG